MSTLVLQSPQTFSYNVDDGILHRECKNLSYEKIKQILENNVILIDHVGCYDHANYRIDTDGRKIKNFISQNFNTRYNFETKNNFSDLIKYFG